MYHDNHCLRNGFHGIYLFGNVAKMIDTPGLMGWFKPDIHAIKRSYRGCASNLMSSNSRGGGRALPLWTVDSPYIMNILNEQHSNRIDQTKKHNITVDNNGTMVICIGPPGSGKTLLLKKLQNPEYVDNTTTSVPTVGTNILNLRLGDKIYTIREIGGTIAPLWPNYFTNVGKIMYVIDASNLCQISAAGVLLYTILVNPLLKYTKFLIVLTKMDASYRQMRNEALLMLQMKRLQSEIRQKITIVETSAITGAGRDDLLKWITDA